MPRPSPSDQRYLHHYAVSVSYTAGGFYVAKMTEFHLNPRYLTTESIYDVQAAYSGRRVALDDLYHACGWLRQREAREAAQEASGQLQLPLLES